MFADPNRPFLGLLMKKRVEHRLCGIELDQIYLAESDYLVIAFFDLSAEASRFAYVKPHEWRSVDGEKLADILAAKIRCAYSYEVNQTEH